MLSHTKHKRLRQAARLVVSFQLFLTSVLPASAGLFGSTPKVPSASESASELERRYHINTGAIQDQGESLNVADSKKVTPEVSLFFSPSDPNEGEKVTARSFPTYFSNDTSKLYFTWYLQREACQPGKPVTAQCDLDSDGMLDHNDWKIMAHRILASNDLDLNNVSYSSDTDLDGYTARFGGDNRVNVPNHCYFRDNASGENYEIADQAGYINWGCTGTLQPVCMVGSSTISSGTTTITDPAGSGTIEGSGTTFTTTTGDDYVSGSPYCSSTGTVSCSVGSPCCVANPATATSCEEVLSTCDIAAGDSTANPVCRHLFPVVPGYTAGDGSYGAEEERFWQTDPRDPDTADNGNKDEANVAGLGRDTFTWNYLKGDKVGVVIEGTSMIPTKHKDSSNAIMWAFSKNKTDRCSKNTNKGSYAKSIEGYQVTIPTIEIDLNDCLKDNLVDPTEGGQATNLELTVTASPEDPIDDVSERGDGDVIEAVATINNAAQGIQDVYYDWRVELSSDGTANPARWVNVTSDLNNLRTINGTTDGRKLLSQVRGNGVNKVQLNMNIHNTNEFNGRAFSGYLSNGTGYLRFRVDAAENFSASDSTRRGRSDVIVKFIASQDKILAHAVTVAGDPARVSLNTASEICSGTVNPADPPEEQALTRLDSKLCRVIRNEIIGLEVSSTNLSNFNWTINGQPLLCNSKVSATSCFDDHQGNVNFFPVIGNVGDTFNVSVTANQVSSATSTEKAVTLSRTFKIVQPTVSIVSNDPINVWPKVLGQYVDTAGTAYTDFSKDTLETFAGNTVPMRALFTPDFLADRNPPQVERSWTVDGVPVGDGLANTISFSADKIGKSVYNVSLSSVYRPSTLIRQAMEDIWGLSALDTTEIYFSNSVQVEQPDTMNIASTGVKKYYALIASYLPGSVLFSLKVLFSVFLILFASGIVFAIIPNAPTSAPVRERRWR